MRPKRFDLDPANVDPNGLCAAITGAGPWTIADDEFVANSASDGIAHQLNLTSTADLHLITITLTGTDADDLALTEAVTGPNNTTVESSGYFKTLTGVSASATLGANTLDIGWVDEIASKTIPINYVGQIAATIAVDVTGTVDFTVQETFDDIQQTNTAVQSAQWLSITALATKTADTISTASVGATAIRMLFNSYTDTAEAQMYVSQPENV